MTIWLLDQPEELRRIGRKLSFLLHITNRHRLHHPNCENNALMCAIPLYLICAPWSNKEILKGLDSIPFNYIIHLASLLNASYMLNNMPGVRNAKTYKIGSLPSKQFPSGGWETKYRIINKQIAILFKKCQNRRVNLILIRSHSCTGMWVVSAQMRE